MSGVTFIFLIFLGGIFVAAAVRTGGFAGNA
jgi:hypothetical protein